MADPIVVARGGEFVPDTFNAERSEKDKIVIHYRFLTIEERNIIASRANREVRDIEGQEDRLVEMLTLIRVREARKMITRVENLSVQDGDDVREITTGEELLNEPGLELLGYEALDHLRKVQEVDTKKPESE
jgi:hypothetical protein